jgi:hypothetical protein
MEWFHPEGASLNYKTKTYNFSMSTKDQHIIDDEVRCFGKWKSSSSNCCHKGVIYPIIGEGDFDGTVKFLNSNGNVDEASVQMFDLATKTQYAAQFKKLEERPTPPIPEPKKPVKKKK